MAGGPDAAWRSRRRPGGARPSPRGAPSPLAGPPDGVLAAAPPRRPLHRARSHPWTSAGRSGAVRGRPRPVAEANDPLCQACGRGRIVDGYCDHCGTPPPDPRNHYVEAPAHLGRRRVRHRQAARAERGRHGAASATEAGRQRAVLVVCDGVSMATDSHIASLAAARAARVRCSTSPSQGRGDPGGLVGGGQGAHGRRGPGERGRARRRRRRRWPTRPRAPSPRRSSRTASSSPGTSATAGSTGCPTGRRAAAPARPGRLVRPRADVQRRAASEPLRPARTPTRSPAGWATDSPDDLTPHLTTLSADEAAGSWSARTGCGTTAPGPEDCACSSTTWSSRSAATPTRRPGPGARRLRQRAGRTRQHHGCPCSTRWARITGDDGRGGGRARGR